MFHERVPWQAAEVDTAVALPNGPSEFEHFAQGKEAAREARLAKVKRPELLTVLADLWTIYARASQLAPTSDWRTWLILAGRGFGKTRAGAEWVMAQLRAGTGIRVALVAATLHEARAVMVEGESGLLHLVRRECPGEGEAWHWEPSNHRLIWKESGNQAILYSAEKPDMLRGAQHHFAWCDEIAKWPRGLDVWDNLRMGLRLGDDPRVMVTTTPRPVPLVKRLIAANDVAITRGATRDNVVHLAPGFVRDLEAEHKGTRIGRQELDGELIEEIEGALWTRDLIERCRAGALPEVRVRTVVGVDPPAGAGPASDACGIVVVSLGQDGRAYVLADASVSGASPERWAQAVAAAAEAWGADRVVAEANNGGAMVESVLRAADATLPVQRVHAAQGKVARAEPVQLLYEGGRVLHVGAFPELEDELCGLIAGGAYEGPGRSPDRADALVWAIHELMLGKRRARPQLKLL